MNRYQRQFSKEIKGLMRASKIKSNYKTACRHNRIWAKLIYSSPCKECKVESCGLVKNKILYCEHKDFYLNQSKI